MNLTFTTRYLLGVLALALGIAVAPADAATTSVNRYGALVVDGHAVFPVSLSYGPRVKFDRRGGSWIIPYGLRRLAADGVTGWKFRPPYTPTHEPWSQNYAATVAAAHAFDGIVAGYGGFSEVNLCQYCGRAPKPLLSGRTIGGSLLASVSRALSHDRGFGVYKGPDEPYLNGVRPGMIASNFRATRASDPRHVWATLQAGGSTRYAGTSFWRPYASVTNIAGVGRFPLKADPAKSTPFSTVGAVTAMARAAQPNHAIWTTLQLCAAGVHAYTDRASGRRYRSVTPSSSEYRFMVWDAIVNGARGLNFFGGHMQGCWTSSDAALGWNWHAWSLVEPTIRIVHAMTPYLVGHRSRMRLAAPWQGVRLYHGASVRRVEVNTRTLRVVIS